MILIDFNNICSIKFSGAVEAILEEQKNIYKKSKVLEVNNSDLLKVKSGFMNYVINELSELKKRYSSNYGELCIISDYRKDMYWRKQLLATYKQSRDNKKSNEFDELVWKNFNQFKQELTDILKCLGILVIPGIVTKFNNIEVSCEADETIAMIALHRFYENHLIVSNDGDMNQLLVHKNIRQYDSTLKKLVQKSRSDIDYKITYDLLAGQKKDDIPATTSNAHLDKAFILWMEKEKSIELVDNPETCFDMKTKFKSFVDEYEKKHYDIQTKEINEGKRKVRRNKSAFKSAGMGEKTVFDIITKYPNIEDFVNQNIIYKDNYNLNKNLYLLDKKHIPKEIQESIINIFESATKSTFNNSEVIRMSFEYGLNSDFLLTFEN